MFDLHCAALKCLWIKHIGIHIEFNNKKRKLYHAFKLNNNILWKDSYIFLSIF